MNQNVTSITPTPPLKVLPGISKGATYVIVAENDEIMVGIKPEVQVVYFDDLRRFWQIGFRLHVYPQEGKHLPERKALTKLLDIGFLWERDGKPERYVGQIRIPACNLTLSPWVIQDHIVQDHLIERLVEGLFERLDRPATGLAMKVTQEVICEAARERFLDMIPNTSINMPETKCYFGKESYYPPSADQPPAKATNDGGDTSTD